MRLQLYFKAENLVLRARSESVGFAEIVNKDRMPLCLKVCKLGCGSIEAPSRGEPKPGPLGPDFYFHSCCCRYTASQLQIVEIQSIYTRYCQLVFKMYSAVILSCLLTLSHNGGVGTWAGEKYSINQIMSHFQPGEGFLGTAGKG